MILYDLYDISKTITSPRGTDGRRASLTYDKGWPSRCTYYAINVRSHRMQCAALRYRIRCELTVTLRWEVELVVRVLQRLYTACPLVITLNHATSTDERQRVINGATCYTSSWNCSSSSSWSPASIWESMDSRFVRVLIVIPTARPGGTVSHSPTTESQCPDLDKWRNSNFAENVYTANLESLNNLAPMSAVV